MLNKVWLLFKIWNRPHLYNQFWSAPKWNKLSLTSWLNLIFPLLILLIHLSFLWILWTGGRIIETKNFVQIFLLLRGRHNYIIQHQHDQPNDKRRKQVSFCKIDGQKNPVLLFSQKVPHDKIMQVIGNINQNLDRFISVVFSVVNFPPSFQWPTLTSRKSCVLFLYHTTHQ